MPYCIQAGILIFGKDDKKRLKEGHKKKDDLFRPAESFRAYVYPIARSAYQGTTDPLTRPGVSGSKKTSRLFRNWFASQIFIKVFH